MKTAIKLVLIYFVMQILAALLVMPFAMLYSYAVSGTIDAASVIALAPSMLLGFVGMGGYLWKKGYLKDDGRIWSPVSVAYLGWSIIIGLSTIFLIDFVMSRLSFLPDWMGATFDVLQSGWLGIICISVLGPVLEEMLFRGAITKVLLQKYSPVKAVILSALIFGIFHINPAQVVGAVLSGVLFAWLYYKTGSLVPRNSDTYPEQQPVGIPQFALSRCEIYIRFAWRTGLLELSGSSGSVVCRLL